MYSNEGEYIEFIIPVLLDGQVEHWLCDIGEYIYIRFLEMFLYEQDVRTNNTKLRCANISTQSARRREKRERQVSFSKRSLDIIPVYRIFFHDRLDTIQSPDVILVNRVTRYPENG